MKHLKAVLLTIPVLLSFVFSAVTFAEENGEYFAHYECENFEVNVLGCDMVNADDGDFVFIYNQFINKKSESAAPFGNVSTKVFQDGIELESGYVNSRVFTPDGYEDDMTSIRPNASVNYYECYKLRNTSSPIELEIGELFSFNSTPSECVLELDGGSVDPDEVSYVSGEPTEVSSKYTELEARVAELEKLVEELLKRIEELEAK